MNDRTLELRSCVDIFRKLVPNEANRQLSHRPLQHQQKSPLSLEALAISTSLHRCTELMHKLERDLTSSGGAFDSKEAQVVEEIRLIGRRLKDAETRMDRLKAQTSVQSLNSTTKKHWTNLLGHSLHPRFKELAKRFKQANLLRVASLQSMHNRHEKYFTKDLVHLPTTQKVPIKNNQLPFQKLNRSALTSSITATSTSVATPHNGYHQTTTVVGGGRSTTNGNQQNGQKQYYQSPYYQSQPTTNANNRATAKGPYPPSSTPSTPSTTSTTSTSSSLLSSTSLNSSNSSNYSNYASTNPYNNGTTAPSSTSSASSSQYTGPGATAQLRNRRGPGAAATTTTSTSSTRSSAYGHVIDNPYAKNISNPYARTNPYSNNNNNSNNNMNRPPSHNNGMMGGMHGMGGGQQQSYSTSNASRARERVENAKMVAKQFAQVGEMTATLAEIVEQQDEWIADLETETDTASEHVERGQTELLKLWQNVSGDRGLMLKMFAVLIFFIILFFWLNRVKG